jgi:hypothetical protein
MLLNSRPYTTFDNNSVGIETVHDDVRLRCVWVLSEQRPEIGVQIFLGAAVSHLSLSNMTTGDVKRSNQRLSAMAQILELDFDTPPWLHRNIWHSTLQDLNARHLIQAEGHFSAFGSLYC